MLGKDLFRGADTEGLTVAALVAFVVSVAASVFVLLPKRNLAFSESGARLYEGLYAMRGEMPEVYRRLSYELERRWASNDLQITLLSRAYTVAAAASVLELLSLAILIWSNVL